MFGWMVCCCQRVAMLSLMSLASIMTNRGFRTRTHSIRNGFRGSLYLPTGTRTRLITRNGTTMRKPTINLCVFLMRLQHFSFRFDKLYIRLPVNLRYGTGRRLCVGIHLAERGAFLAIAKIIWAFDVLPGRDSTGQVIENDLSWETGTDGGIIVTPKPFACELHLRSTKKKEVIWSEFKSAENNVFPKYLVPEQ